MICECEHPMRCHRKEHGAHLHGKRVDCEVPSCDCRGYRWDGRHRVEEQ